MKVYRFAPSPTGFLHVGGARTAIFNWLLARKSKGKFLLRIEDTDAKRSSDEYSKQIKNSLKWLGLFWDEDPLYQSQRYARYNEIAEKLLQEKKAYYCFCTPEQLKEKREIAEKNKTDYVYDKTCRNLSESEIESKLANKQLSTIRLKTELGQISINDNIMGKVTTDERLIGDYIIVRSDGTPIYQLAVVVDDHDMQVTDVIRGADHLANTFKQYLIFTALNWKIPNYAHLPLILGIDKKRLSKRHGSASVEEFISNGILPDALFNYLCLLGWSSGDDLELFNKDELINRFDLNGVNNSNAIFDQKKLVWMNAKYISQMTSQNLLELSSEYNTEKENLEEFESESLVKLADLVKIRSETLIDFEKRMLFFYKDPNRYNQEGVRKYFTMESIEILQLIKEKLDTINEYTSANIELIIRNLAESLDLKVGKIIHPLRLALTGDIASPGIFEIIEILGREKINRRINRAIEYINTNTEIPIN